MEEGLRTSCRCASSLAGWTGRTRHQPLLIPPLLSLSGEQLQALSVGLGRKTVISYTFLVSEGCTGCLP